MLVIFIFYVPSTSSGHLLIFPVKVISALQMCSPFLCSRAQVLTHLSLCHNNFLMALCHFHQHVWIFVEKLSLILLRSLSYINCKHITKYLDSFHPRCCEIVSHLFAFMNSFRLFYCCILTYFPYFYFIKFVFIIFV